MLEFREAEALHIFTELKMAKSYLAFMCDAFDNNFAPDEEGTKII